MATQQALRLWELAGADPKRVFSPYVWRVRLVLAHKGVGYESATWRYNDKPLIAPAQKVEPSSAGAKALPLRYISSNKTEQAGSRPGCREFDEVD